MKLKNFQIYLVLTAILGLSFLSMATNVKAYYMETIGTGTGTDDDNTNEAKTSGYASAVLTVKMQFPGQHLYYYPNWLKGGLDPNVDEYWDQNIIVREMYPETSGMTVKHWAGINNIGYSPALSTTLKAYSHFSENTYQFDWWVE